VNRPAVTVVVCAYTEIRWDDTREAVRSVTTQVIEGDQVLLVVDHNAALAARFREDVELAGVDVLENAYQRGLSGARNTALDHATGEIVAFLDDDATAEPGWLRNLLLPYTSPDVIAVGGAAQPRWPRLRPATLPAGEGAAGELDWVVGCTYRGQPTDVRAVRNLMGCNMSFRRDVFERVGRFSESIGRVGKTPLGCEETELCIRAAHKFGEGRILFTPHAVVRHTVTDDRTTWRYLIRRSWSEGVSKALVSASVGKSDALSAERSYVLRVLPRAFLREIARGSSGVLALVLALMFAQLGFWRGRTARQEIPEPAVEWDEPRPELTGPRPPVSIVVPTADRPEAVVRCVKSLLNNEYPDLEVIVVDNRPAGASGAVLRALAADDSRVRVLAEPRSGVSRARNLGWRSSDRPLVGFVDDDIEVDRLWVATLVAELADDRIDCVTSQVLPASLDTEAQQAFERLKGFSQGRRRCVWPDASIAAGAIHPGHFGPGGSALWRRSTLDVLGGFDPLLGPGTPTKAGEDLEMFLRLARQRGGIVYTPHAVAWHEHEADFPAVRRQLRGYGTGLAATYTLHLLRHPDHLVPIAGAVASRAAGRKRRGEPVPQARRLMAAQLAGVAAGPIALARGVLARRRSEE
jgi:glycosyltransferase involved in cell wall biosynthesis